MTERTIRTVAHLPRQPHAEGFAVAFLHRETVGGGFGPFLQIDAFALAQPVFKPHPHAGFSAVTYILPESPIGFINRDSLGDRTRIGPGALHWTAAGSGLLHEEVPERLGTAALGLQMFIDLPAAAKHMAPQVIHIDAEDIPVAHFDGGSVRVVVGEANNVSAAIDPPTPNTLLIDITLAPGGRFAQALDAHDEACVYLLAGSATVGETELAAFDLAASALDGERLSLVAGPEGARAILFGGRPLDQPVVARGPFVLASEAALRTAMNDYAAGRMGSLTANRFDPAGVPIE
jgi:redox-sensitive bicupin YhaK (pirin superfamily)